MVFLSCFFSAYFNDTGAAKENNGVNSGYATQSQLSYFFRIALVRSSISSYNYIKDECTSSYSLVVKSNKTVIVLMSGIRATIIIKTMIILMKT